MRAVAFAVTLLATLGANYLLDRFRFWRAGIPWPKQEREYDWLGRHRFPAAIPPRQVQGGRR
jgi:hypothetical protein